MNRSRFPRGVGIAALLTLALSGPSLYARGAEIEGVTFSPRNTAGTSSLELRGLGLLRYRSLFKVSVAALYLPVEIENTALLDDVPRSLEIEYFYGIAADQFRQLTLEGIRRNGGDSTVDRNRAEIAELNALYRDIGPGDRYALTYAPGLGTTLALNGRPLGTVSGAEFSRALFSIWFGPEPIDRGLRRALLGET